MMKENHLHIISFDVPYPADYGGVIDVFYKLVALHQIGIKIHLHCFQYGREEAKILESYCEDVKYYSRKTGLMANLSATPYIIKSRDNRQLIDNLCQNDYPILCEGMHTCGILLDKKLQSRKIVYRSSNIEHNYYQALAQKEKNSLRKLFFSFEYKKLKKWEQNLSRADLFLTVSEDDKAYYQTKFPRNMIENIFSFFNQSTMTSTNFDNNEKYLLFHGNLSVHENASTAIFIINEIAPLIDYQVIIAGKNPSTNIVQAATKQQNVKLTANPSEEEMQKIIGDAHINLLLTDQATGLKLKLLNSLYQGKFCLVNEMMLAGTGLHNCVEIANSTKEITTKINELMLMEFDEQIYSARRQNISIEFSNDYKAEKLVQFIF